jgi:hypothetical protein
MLNSIIAELCYLINGAERRKRISLAMRVSPNKALFSASPNIPTMYPITKKSKPPAPRATPIPNQEYTNGRAKKVSPPMSAPSAADGR